jgi:hypothetical protein
MPTLLRSATPLLSTSIKPHHGLAQGRQPRLRPGPRVHHLRTASPPARASARPERRRPTLNSRG